MNISVKRFTLIAMLLAMTIVLSSFSIPVPGGHLYFNDLVIVTAALMLNPVEAFIVGGLGSFLGDLFFYPTPMFVSLVTHGLQAIVISLLISKKEHPTLKDYIFAVTIGAIIMIVGYTIGRSFFYASPKAAMLKLPFQIVQASFGAFMAVILHTRLPLKKFLK